ncbi:low temperature requirement protein A [Paractinoplanes atraurantiacus]|uniref:Low temperature requirement protein LtrA n=1 Tax=Paractinoplanes atraurantiacus TaxID=1036182 RepID=A0A285F067_9ACTN|nr:low temperature requirement protein A [Actinoplanes atraurantiacus]SNY04659.1 Low temperature requirement protein LtrA [Actinoplanes atraurantiacus]
MTSPVRTFLAPMRARSADEPHRVSTPLELFFDLCFVVAVAQAALPLHHSIAEHHVGHGLYGYLTVFFAIWWAWMNFTWFASAYDTDDDVYRITTLVQIAGALVLAAGVEAAFERTDFLVITVGYVIMRLALVSQWLRAARSDPPRRATAYRYAVGVTAVQVLWLLRLLIPHDSPWITPAFVALAILELAVPVWAEAAPGGPTTYHPHHITERYGLFTIIVLGEAVLSATVAFQSAFDEGEHEFPLISLAISGIVIVFALWWTYFDRSAHNLITRLRTSLMWGYGHYFIFAAAAAVGAGIGVNVDYATHHAEISRTVAAYAIAVPVAVYLFFVWLLHIRPHQRGLLLATYPVGVVLCLLTPLVPGSVEVLAVLLVVLVAVNSMGARRVPDPIA